MSACSIGCPSRQLIVGPKSVIRSIRGKCPLLRMAAVAIEVASPHSSLIHIAMPKTSFENLT